MPARSTSSPPGVRQLAIFYVDLTRAASAAAAAEIDFLWTWNIRHLANPAAYVAAYPDCHIMNADINGDGSVDFDDINLFVSGRKNRLLAGSAGGAENAASLYSLVVSCKRAGGDPFAYFRDVRLRSHTHPAERSTELIPRAGKTRFGSPIPAPVKSAA